MCTATWIYHANGYELFFNRDEKLTRGLATPVEHLYQIGTEWLAALDSDSGGTWLGVNEYGLTLCLLNGPTTRRGSVSRGWAIPGLMDSPRPEDAIARLSGLPLDAYAPFTVLAIASDGVARVAVWDGVRLQLEDAAESMRTSSSFAPESVAAARQRRYREMAARSGGVSPKALADYHRSHNENPDAWSVCVHRADAETVSLSHIVVTATEVTYQFQHGAPCRGTEHRQSERMVRRGL